MMMPKRNEAPVDGETPRSLYAYLLLGLVAIVVVAGAYANRGAITALVAGASAPSPQAAAPNAIGAMGSPALADPVCAAECGRACWLVSSGSAEGTFESAQGRIGTLGCDGMCWSASDALSQCCSNADCPREKPTCSRGVCVA
ncbi:MAG: hypothetical protein QW548_03375 [Candidatus Aenigmatarchaeota archaeon]